jgi:hypothetical protein
VSDASAESRPSFGVARLAEETRERFVREIVARVPLARLVELHLFAPIRQGGMESGVAVLAALQEVRPPAEEAAPVVDLPPVAAADEAPVDEAPVEEAERCDPTDAAAGRPPEVEVVEAPEPVPEAMETVDVEALIAEPEPSPDAPPAPPAPAPPARRHTVFTARYRLVTKGPERGKWDVEVREEADAPLVTVDAVVRGVQMRSGEASDPERLDAIAVARLLGLPSSVTVAG